LIQVKTEVLVLKKENQKANEIILELRGQ